MELKSRKGVWQAICYYIDPKTGESIRVPKSTRIKDDGTKASEDIARIEGHTIQKLISLGKNRPKEQITLKHAFEERIKDLETANKPQSTIDRTLYSAAAIFDLIPESTNINDKETITKTFLRNYAHNRMVEQKASGETVKRELADMAAAFKSVGVPFPEKPKLPKRVPRERWLRPQECTALLNELAPRRAKAVMLALQTGARKSEVFDTVWLRSQLALIQGTKTPSSRRTMPLTAIAEAILQEGQLEPWTNAGRDLKAAAKRAKLGPVSWNTLRRTFASQLILAGVSTTHVQRLLGHTTSRMVDEIYARLKEGELFQSSVEMLPSYSHGIQALSSDNTTVVVQMHALKLSTNYTCACQGDHARACAKYVPNQHVPLGLSMDK